LDPIIDSWLKLYFDCHNKKKKNQFGEYIYFRILLVSYEFVMKTKQLEIFQEFEKENIVRLV